MRSIAFVAVLALLGCGEERARRTTPTNLDILSGFVVQSATFTDAFVSGLRIELTDFPDYCANAVETPLEALPPAGIKLLFLEVDAQGVYKSARLIYRPSCTSEQGVSQPATTGDVTVSDFRPAEIIAGTYSATFDGAATMGMFSAERCDRPDGWDLPTSTRCD